MIAVRVIEFITRGDDMGGAQLHVVDLSSRLQDDGHEVLVITGPAGIVTDQLDRAGVPWLSIPQLRREIHLLSDIRVVRDLVRTIRSFQPDLIACHSSKAGIIGRLAARLTGTPVIFTVHGWAFTEGIPWRGRLVYRALERAFSTLASQMICVSEFDRDLGRKAGIPDELLVTVHNGIPDVDRSSVAPEVGHRNSHDCLRLIMVGRFVPQKDQETLIRAIVGVPDVEVEFVGDGPLLPDHRQLAEMLGVADRCTFHGLRLDVDQMLRDSDVFCLISRWEGFPIATLEAMRVGLPTVVSDVGGAGEAVIDGVTGFVIPRGDVMVLRARLKALAGDPALRCRMGAAARERYLSHFTFEEMYQRTLDVYRQVARTG